MAEPANPVAVLYVTAEEQFAEALARGDFDHALRWAKIAAELAEQIRREAADR
jgi:hypothetical protein